jgi:regulatory protein
MPPAAPHPAISSIRPVGRDGLLSLLVAGRRVALIEPIDAQRLNLAPGLAYTPALSLEVARAARWAAAKRRAARWLARRPRSREHTRAQLLRWDYGDVADAALDALQRLGLIDDQALARSLDEHLQRRGPAAPALRNAHRQRLGLSADDAEQRDPANAASLETDLRRFAEKTLAALPQRLPPVALARRLLARLLRRGFDESQAQAAALHALRTAGHQVDHLDAG